MRGRRIIPKDTWQQTLFLEHASRHEEKDTSRIGFKVNRRRMAASFRKMLPVFDKNRAYFTSLSIFPQYNILRVLDNGYSDRFKAQILVMTAYFDRLKVSRIHYLRDMPVVIDELVHGTMFQEDRLLKHQLVRPCTPNHDLDVFGYLQGLSPEERNLFLRKRIYTNAIRIEDAGKNIQGNPRINNTQAYFEDMLATMVNTYGSDPRNMFLDGVQEGYQRLLQIPGFGPGLAYLATFFLGEAGLIEESPAELGLPPKIDRNDLAVASLTGMLEVYQKIRASSVIPSLSNALLDHATALKRPVHDLDECLWAVSQLYARNHLPLEARLLNPAKGLFTQGDFLHWRNRYYATGHLCPTR